MLGRQRVDHDDDHLHRSTSHFTTALLKSNSKIMKMLHVVDEDDGLNGIDPESSKQRLPTTSGLEAHG